MAAKKKAKKSKKAPAKKAKKRAAKPARRAPPKRKAKATKKKAPRRIAAKKTPAKKAVRKTAAKASTSNKEYGEGNYKATQRFDTAQESFVQAHKSDIPAMGRAAEAALDGPEGKDLRAAEEEAKGHAAGEQR